MTVTAPGPVESAESVDRGGVRVLYDFRWSLTALWFTGLILLILVRFWSYWSTLI